MRQRIRLGLLLALSGLSALLAACNFAFQTPTPELTMTPSPTASPSATVTFTPSVTPTPTTVLTATPTPSPSNTPTPTVSPTPSATPFPTAGFANDQWTSIDVREDLRAGLASPWFAILSVNERTEAVALETPEATPNEENLYLVNPSSGEKVAILSLPATTGDRVYWSPDGNKLLYFLEPMLLPDGTQAGGLYLLNLSLGISLRLFNITTLSPRGIPDHRPVWSPDSSQFAIALPTAYDVDIYIIAADGSNLQNATASGSYDLWPAWSPDGRRLAFVSDRDQCPSWVPGDPDSCSALDSPVPNKGKLYVLEVESGEVRQVAETELDGPPTWVSNLQAGFTTGLSDPFAAESTIWLANIQSGTLRQISEPDVSLYLGAAWSPGGLQVLYYRVTDPASVILKDSSGSLISSTDDYLFSRFGFAAAWSPQGDKVAFGGRNGQCPLGLVVARNDLSPISGPATSPRACDPAYSPDGRWLAYAGIQYRAGVDDGRLDLYVADANGYSARNLTGSLKGEIRLLGWVGGTP